MLRLTVADRWEADLGGGIDLSIPLHFGGPQPNAFGLPRATGAVVVSTADGGPVNCVTVTLNPHGNGTHTECAGHVFSDDLDVRRAAPLELIPCCLVSVSPRDNQVQASDLAGALKAVPPPFQTAVVLRTGLADPLQNHTGQSPPSLHPDAARELRNRGVEHLLLDQPSVDPEDDGGLVASHKIFFEDVAVGARRTITEMVAIPSTLADGLYVLSLHVAPFVLDAAPSRPVLFPVVAV